MQKIRYSNPNDEYFKVHISEFVKSHAGEWVVIAGGQLIGFTCKENISTLVKKARKQFLDDTPLLSPMPQYEELAHILWISKFQNKKKPNFEDVSAKVKRVIKRHRLKPKVIEEAIQWARKQVNKNYARKRPIS